MYKKFLSFLLIICLCMGIMPNTIVFATEFQEDERVVFGIECSEEDEQIVSEESEIEIPQNGSKVYMEDVESQIITYSLPTSKERYTILVLDCSSSMTFSYNGSVFYTADTALPYVQKASKKFVETIIKESGNNYTAIVSYSGDTSSVVSQFTNDTDALTKAINSLSITGGGCSVYSGLTAAEKLIDSVSNKNAIKNVVLFTTGMTCLGEYSYLGHYSSSTVGARWTDTITNIHLYAYANSAYAAAEKLKEKCTIYSIGLFDSLKDMPEQGRDIVNFFKLCACDWASSKNHFYEVRDPDDLEFVFGKVADSIVKRTGTFSFPSSEMDKNITSTYYYDDNYFSKPSVVFYQELATMSLCLELSAWGSKDESDYTKKMKNAEDMFYELGFVGFDHNYTDFTEDGINGKPTKDSIGVVTANKLITIDGKEYTLIAVAIRGGGYEREWASNFTIGENGDHQGFSEARDIVITFLEKYIIEQGIDGNIKLWITGYSRAGAVANMVGGAIDDGKINLGNCILKFSDMFVYTFETPAGVVDLDDPLKYNNIFNVINTNDLVPKLAPKTWNFGRYGINKYISSPESDGVNDYQNNVAAMVEMYQKMEGYPGYELDDFSMKKYKIDVSIPDVVVADDTKDTMSQGIFLDNYVTTVTKKHLKKRKTYVDKYQSAARDVCGIIYGSDPAKIEKLKDSISKKIDIGTIIWQLITLHETLTYNNIAKELKECLDEAEIYNYSQEDFEKSVNAICHLALDAFLDDPSYIATIFANSDKFKQAHYPELCLAWMQSMDPNYTTDAGSGFSSGKYRIVRVNCPVDIAVYDADGNTIASIVDDTPQPDGHVLAAFNEKGEKLIYLPVNHDYVVKITATGDGVMNYAVQEYDPNVGETNHLVLFNDIEIAEGQEFTAYLPSYSEEDINGVGTVADTDYTLFLGETQILLSEELAGEEVFNAYYDVSAVTSDAETGIVFGSGIYQYGTFAKMTAVAYDGYEFVGWYDGEDSVSSEEEYRFRVSNDVELVAVFKEISQKETPNESTDGTGDSTSDDTDDGKGDGREGTIEGSFRVVSHWNTGFNGEITLTNTTDEVVHNWVVIFDLPYEIVNLWNGVIVSYGNEVYAVQNAGYNCDIEPGESVAFGFSANVETETITGPTYYTLIEKPAKTVKQNYEIVYNVNSDWGTAFNGQIIIRNLSSEDIFDWTLEFDCVQNISQFWNAEIVSHEGYHYVIKNKGYNAAIGAGQSLVLGFEARCGNVSSSYEPSNYRLTQRN